MSEAHDLFSTKEKNGIELVKQRINMMFFAGMPVMFNNQYNIGNIVVAGSPLVRTLQTELHGRSEITSYSGSMITWMLDSDNQTTWAPILTSFADIDKEPKTTWYHFCERALAAGVEFRYYAIRSGGEQIKSAMMMKLYRANGVEFETVILYQTTYKTLEDFLCAQASQHVNIDGTKQRPVYMYREKFYASRESFDRALVSSSNF